MRKPGTRPPAQSPTPSSSTLRSADPADPGAGRPGGLSRRALLGSGAALGALAALGAGGRPARAADRAAAGALPVPLWPGYPEAMVIDGLCGLDLGDSLPLPDDVLAVVDRSGITAINMTVPAPREGFEGAVRRFARLQRAAEVHADRLLLVRSGADLERAKREGRLGIIAGAQSTDLYGDDLDRLDLFRGLGLRIAQLTYNDRSLYGDGCLEPGNAGLSRLGRQAVARMNELGIAVDLSHAGQRTTAEGIAASERPPLISHTGCNAVYRHPRNNDDAELRAAADQGGVVGIYLMPFLDGGTGELTTDMLFAHLDHALDVCGVDHVGIGSDQGVVPVADGPEYREALRKEVEQRRAMGISAPGESPDRPPFIPALNSERHMDRIAAEMARRGRPDRVIEKVVGANFGRALTEAWGGPGAPALANGATELVNESPTCSRRTGSSARGFTPRSTQAPLRRHTARLCRARPDHRRSAAAVPAPSTTSLDGSFTAH